MSSKPSKKDLAEAGRKKLEEFRKAKLQGKAGASPVKSGSEAPGTGASCSVSTAVEDRPLPTAVTSNSHSGDNQFNTVKPITTDANGHGYKAAGTINFGTGPDFGGNTTSSSSKLGYENGATALREPVVPINCTLEGSVAPAAFAAEKQATPPASVNQSGYDTGLLSDRHRTPAHSYAAPSFSVQSAGLQSEGYQISEPFSSPYRASLPAHAAVSDSFEVSASPPHANLTPAVSTNPNYVQGYTTVLDSYVHSGPDVSTTAASAQFHADLPDRSSHAAPVVSTNAGSVQGYASTSESYRHPPPAASTIAAAEQGHASLSGRCASPAPPVSANTFTVHGYASLSGNSFPHASDVSAKSSSVQDYASLSDSYLHPATSPDTVAPSIHGQARDSDKYLNPAPAPSVKSAEGYATLSDSYLQTPVSTKPSAAQGYASLSDSYLKPSPGLGTSGSFAQGYANLSDSYLHPSPGVTSSSDLLGSKPAAYGSTGANTTNYSSNSTGSHVQPSSSMANGGAAAYPSVLLQSSSVPLQSNTAPNPPAQQPGTVAELRDAVGPVVNTASVGETEGGAAFPSLGENLHLTEDVALLADMEGNMTASAKCFREDQDINQPQSMVQTSETLGSTKDPTHFVGTHERLASNTGLEVHGPLAQPSFEQSKEQSQLSTPAPKPSMYSRLFGFFPSATKPAGNPGSKATTVEMFESPAETSSTSRPVLSNEESSINVGSVLRTSGLELSSAQSAVLGPNSSSLRPRSDNSSMQDNDLEAVHTLQLKLTPDSGAHVAAAECTTHTGLPQPEEQHMVSSEPYPATTSAVPVANAASGFESTPTKHYATSWDTHSDARLDSLHETGAGSTGTLKSLLETSLEQSPGVNGANIKGPSSFQSSTHQAHSHEPYVSSYTLAYKDAVGTKSSHATSEMDWHRFDPAVNTSYASSYLGTDVLSPGRIVPRSEADNELPRNSNPVDSQIVTGSHGGYHPSRRESGNITDKFNAFSNSSLASSGQQFQALQDIIDQLTREKLELERGLSQQARINDNLMTENSSIAERFNEQGKLLASLKDTVKRYEAEVKAQSFALEGVAMERDSCRASAQEASSRASVLASEVVSLEQRLLEAKSSKLKLDRELEEVRTSYQRVDKQLGAAVREKTAAVTEAQQAASEKRSLLVKLRQMEVKLSMLAQHTPGLAAKLQELSSSIHDVERKDQEVQCDDIDMAVPSDPAHAHIVLSQSSDNLARVEAAPVEAAEVSARLEAIEPPPVSGDMLDTATSSEPTVLSPTIIERPISTPISTDVASRVLGSHAGHIVESSTSEFQAVVHKLVRWLPAALATGAPSPATAIAEEEIQYITSISNLLEQLEYVVQSCKAEVLQLKIANESLLTSNGDLRSKLQAQTQKLELAIQQSYAYRQDQGVGRLPSSLSGTDLATLGQYSGPGRGNWLAALFRPAPKTRTRHALI